MKAASLLFPRGLLLKPPSLHLYVANLRGFARRPLHPSSSISSSSSSPPPRMMGPSIPPSTPPSSPSHSLLPDYFYSTVGGTDSPFGPLFADISPLIRMISDPLSSFSASASRLHHQRLSDGIMAEAMRELNLQRRAILLDQMSIIPPDVQQIASATPSKMRRKKNEVLASSRTSHHYLCGVGADDKQYERDEMIQSDSTGKKTHVVKNAIEGVVKTVSWDCAPGQLEKDCLHVVSYDSTADKDLFDAEWIKYAPQQIARAEVASQRNLLGVSSDTLTTAPPPQSIASPSPAPPPTAAAAAVPPSTEEDRQDRVSAQKTMFGSPSFSLPPPFPPPFSSASPSPPPATAAAAKPGEQGATQWGGSTNSME